MHDLCYFSYEARGHGCFVIARRHIVSVGTHFLKRINVEKQSEHCEKAIIVILNVVVVFLFTATNIFINTRHFLDIRAVIT